MRILWIVLFYLLFISYQSQLVIGPFTDLNITVANEDWQPCYVFEASSNSASFDDIAALCPGPLALGQTSAINPFNYATFVRAYPNVTVSLPVSSSAVWGNYTFYRTATALNYGTVALTDCSAATLNTSILCWNINATSNSFSPGGFASNGDGYQLQPSIVRVLYSAPCYGVANGSACNEPFEGLCKTGGICLGGNACENANFTTAPFISNDTCSMVGACNPYNGSYAIVPKVDGSSCFYGNFCIVNDACSAGVCVPGNYSNVCQLPSSICYAAPICSSTNVTFNCTYPLNDGSTCQADADYLCRNGDVCSAGTCVPGINVTTLYNTSTCATAYYCNSTTGIVSPNVTALGTPCTPSNPCFSAGVCNNTICYGTTPTAPFPTPASFCLSATCDANTGNFTYNAINTGFTCTPPEGNDTCNSYACLGGNCTFSNQYFCPALECQEGTCVNNTGCVYTPLNGTACGSVSLCNGYGMCNVGTCQNFGALNCTNAYPSIDPFCGYTYCDESRGCQVNATNLLAHCSSNPCVPLISSRCNAYAQCNGTIVPSLPGCFLAISSASRGWSKPDWTYGLLADLFMDLLY